MTYFKNTDETKEVDLDLEKECLEFVKSEEFIKSSKSPVSTLAIHFFELGLQVGNKAKKNEKACITINRKVKIDRKVLFEICDAILSHDGFYDRNDCPENDSPYFVDDWDSDFRKKVENIRNNS